METRVTLERARDIVDSHSRSLGSETVKLKDAYNRVLAEKVVSPLDMPPFFRSPLDGFAYKAKALEDPPVRLKMISEIPAGTFSDQEIGEGECAKIFTGAPIPPGANCVVRMEDTTRDSDNLVVIKRPVLPGSNIIHQGEEIKKGQSLFDPGVVLTPAVIGVLASLGIDSVVVNKLPRIGLLVTGSELTEVGEQLAPAKIYNSNGYTLYGMLKRLGCEVQQAALIQDSTKDIAEVLKAYQDLDMVISTGGASVGEYDLVREALQEAGCDLLFWKVDFKPGTPIAVAKRGKQLLFSLSGNPAAAMITFDLIVRPAIEKLKGRLNFAEETFPVKVKSGFGKSSGQRRFLRAGIVFKEGEVWADPTVAQESGVLLSMTRSDLLLEVPAGSGPVQEGQLLLARWFGGRVG